MYREILYGFILGSLNDLFSVTEVIYVEMSCNRSGELLVGTDLWKANLKNKALILSSKYYLSVHATIRPRIAVVS